MIKNKLVCGGPELDIPKDLSLSKHVINKLKGHGNKIALINAKTQQQTTFKQLVDRIVHTAQGLRRMGLGPGDVVALCSENCSEIITVTVAASAVGATVTFINIKYSQDELLHTLNISKPSLILCSEATLERKFDNLLELRTLKHIVQLDGIVKAKDVLPLSAIEVSDSSGEDFETEQVSPEDTALIFYSSGTTGLPKGVMLTHQNVLHGLAIYNYDSKGKENLLTITPWYHVYGLLSTMEYLISGYLVVYLTDFVPDIYLGTIEKYQISAITAVPPMMYILAKSPLVEKYNLSSLRHILCAAAPLSKDMTKSALKKLPNCEGIFQAYGMTETTLAIVKYLRNCNGQTKPGSCGIPLRGTIVKVVDICTRERLGPNEEGEVCVKGPTLMKGYVDNEAATKAMIDEEGFMMTGDIGYYDNDGWFYIVDRLKEIIKYKGQQVAPSLVESVILEHEGVAECGVVGAPHELAGELPTAFVVRKPGSALTEQDLLNFTSERLSSYSRLRGGVIFVEEIPKNASGKILRRKLRNILM